MTKNTAVQADFAGAIATLKATSTLLEQRRAKLDETISTVKSERARKLDRKVGEMLPDISKETYLNLKRTLSAFASLPGISDAFRKNYKVFWIFKGRDYDAAFVLLQSRLKVFLMQAGEVRTEDKSLVDLESKRATLLQQWSDALELIGLLERALASGKPVSAKSAASIKTIAQRGSAVSARPVNRSDLERRNESAPDRSPRHEEQSDGDLWLWMMTDIPTSFRTVMLDAVSNKKPQSGGFVSDSGSSQTGGAIENNGSVRTGGGIENNGSFQTGGAIEDSGNVQTGGGFGGDKAVFATGGGFGGDDGQTPNQTSYEGNAPVTSDSDNDAGNQAAAADQVQSASQPDSSIATDDRLGAFS
jgi:hypothetical protein